jgi:MFS family permease
MVRWTLFAAVGDVLAPLVAASAIALGSSYRGAMLAVAAVVSIQCVGSFFLRAGSSAEPSGDSTPSLRAAIASATRKGRLWAWLFAAASCTLLDEIVVALAALRMARDQGASEMVATAAAVTFSIGAVLGASITDAAVARLSSRRVLVTSGVACALALVILLSTGSVLASCAALFFVGLTCAPHHALCQARAYEELPDNPGTVQAIARIFVLTDVLAPLALGVVADRLGLRVAIGCLLAQPAIIVACSALCRARSSDR